MNISELIERLTRFRERLGDVEVQAFTANSSLDWYEITDISYDRPSEDKPWIVELEIDLTGYDD